MNEQELRLLVRAAVARHLGNAAPTGQANVGRGFPGLSGVEASRAEDRGGESVPLPLLSSHSLYAGLVNVGDACVIEPAVSCDHCGYCKAHGF